MFTKQKIGMLVAEFFGTAVLTLAVLAVSTSNIGIGYFVSFAAGLAVLLMVFAFGPVSGGIFNPALTIGLWTVRKVQSLQAIAYIAVQLLGGVAAYALFSYMAHKGWNNTTHGFDGRIFVAELVGTLVFSMGIAAAIYQDTTRTAKAVIMGGSLTLGIIVASAASAGYLNPAVALGARSWDWSTYVLGPILGAVIGVNLYSLLFAPAPTAKAATAATASPVAAMSTTKATSAKPAAKTTKRKTVASKSRSKRK